MIPLTGPQAWRSGFRTLSRHPWLALLPLAADLVQIGLAWLGIPLGPITDLPRLLNTDYALWLAPRPSPTGRTISITGFIPGPLPSLTDLHLSLQPARLAFTQDLPPWLSLGAQLLVPAVGALCTALFLGLVADVTRGELNASSWRRALRAFPGLFAVLLLWRLALSLFGVPGLVLLTIAALATPLLQIALGAEGQPLFIAILDGASRFWGRLGSWLLLWPLSGVSTGLFTLIWSLAGRPVWLALLLYPFLGTALVAGAVALFLSPEVTPAEMSPKRLHWLWVPLLALVGTLGGAWLMEQWAGFSPTPEAAIRNLPIPIAGESTILQTVRHEDREFYLLRTTTGELVLVGLQTNQFGWRPLFRNLSFRVPGVQAEGTARVRIRRLQIERDAPMRTIIWGELADPRVTAFRIDDQVVPVGEGRPTFLFIYDGEPKEIQTLDLAGQVLAKEWSR